MDIGERLRALREKAGYSQNALADKAGIAQTHLRKVELGQSGISVDHLGMVCDALGISLKEFFDFKTEPDEFSEVLAKISPKQKKLLLEFLKTIQ